MDPRRLGHDATGSMVQTTPISHRHPTKGYSATRDSHRVPAAPQHGTRDKALLCWPKGQPDGRKSRTLPTPCAGRVPHFKHPFPEAVGDRQDVG